MKKDSEHIQKERDTLLKEQLRTTTIKIIERYRLKSTKAEEWIACDDNAHEHKIFTQQFLLKHDDIAILFRINRLCWGKVRYFQNNYEKFTPYKYDPNEGFIKTELWDSDFLQHKASEKMIDYRFLARITEFDIFLQFCNELQTFEK